MKNYKIYFRLKGNTDHAVMEFIKEGLNCDDARSRAREILGPDFLVVDSKLIRDWIGLGAVLNLPYGTRLERYESDYIYVMEQELKIINLESERDYPAITKDILKAKFRIIK